MAKKVKKTTKKKAAAKKAVKKTAKVKKKKAAKKTAKTTQKRSTKKKVKKVASKSARTSAKKRAAKKTTASSSRRQTRRRPKTTLSKKELAHFRELLITKLKEITGDVDHIEAEALKRSRMDATGDLSSMPIHMADIGSDNYEQEFALGLMHSERKIVLEIFAALKRIENGTYGICEGTGEPIPKPRLEGIPWTRYCVAYAEKIEKGLVSEEDRWYDFDADEDEDVEFEDEGDLEDEDGEDDEDDDDKDAFFYGYDDDEDEEDEDFV